MKMIELNENLRKFDIHCEASLLLYINLVTNNDIIPATVYTEKHHILPVAMFPEYTKDKQNIVILTYDQHVKAHEYLAKMYNTLSMKRAFKLMLRFNPEERKKQAELLRDLYSGDKNPACLPGVGKKISEAKTGVPRPDMKGKRYFGATDEHISRGIKAMSEKMKGTVTVKDKNNNMFKVSINDPRYISKELIPNACGTTIENHWMKNKDSAKSIIDKRNIKYAEFKDYTFNEIVEFLILSYNSGKIIFGKHTPFSSNFSKFVNFTQFNQIEIKKAVVQRLEKDSNI